MTLRAQIFALALAVAGLVAILWLVRRRSLKERFALLWIVIGLGMVLLVLVRPWLDRVSELLGIRSGTSTLFLLAILFLLGLILHQSIIISGLEEKLRDTAEAVALLRADLEKLGEAVPPVDGSDDRQDES